MAVRKGMPAVVRRICLWCQGGSWKRVGECADDPCPLYPWRTAEVGDDAALRARIVEFCLSCAGSPEAVAECGADTPMGGQPACPAHPYRFVVDEQGEPLSAPAPEPVPVQITVVQQVRLLPGLGGVSPRPCPAPTEPPAPLAPPRPSGNGHELPPALSLPEALATLTPERAPEALDI